VMGAADRDKVIEIRRAAVSPVLDVMPINAQMWYLSPALFGSLAAAALESELAEVWVRALTLPTVPMQGGSG